MGVEIVDLSAASLSTHSHGGLWAWQLRFHNADICQDRSECSKVSRLHEDFQAEAYTLLVPNRGFSQSNKDVALAAMGRRVRFRRNWFHCQRRTDSMTHHQPIRAAIYVRIASKRESDAHMIASRVSALRTRASQDTIPLVEYFCFIDGGYSGALLVRPALTRSAQCGPAAGTLDRLYVQSPDRLVRTYVCQALLLDEFQCCGVEVIFRNLPLDGSADDQLLLQVQGMMTEEESTAAGSAIVKEDLQHEHR